MRPARFAAVSITVEVFWFGNGISYCLPLAAGSNGCTAAWSQRRLHNLIQNALGAKRQSISEADKALMLLVGLDISRVKQANTGIAQPILVGQIGVLFDIAQVHGMCRGTLLPISRFQELDKHRDCH